ncbi:MAG: hypothetical protein U0794_20545 [Isosphaeraceae bacterium]
MDGATRGLNGAPEDGPPEPLRRPRDLAVLLLAAETRPPRQRARDQQADLAGLALRHRLLEAIVEVDPERGEFDAALASLVEALGEPSGPTRALARQIRQEWDDAEASPAFWTWLLGEAIEQSQQPEPRRRGRGEPSRGTA